MQLNYIDLLEKVQHRATKMIQGISCLEYEERLRSLNMYSLEMRRTRGYFIQLFKFVKQEDTEGLNLNRSYKRAWAKVREITHQQGG